MSNLSNLLHIYPQYTNHSEAVIVGDRKSLLLLIKTIEAALAHGVAGSLHFVSDGEGYSCLVMESKPDEIDQMPFPYQDEIFHDRNAKSKPALNFLPDGLYAKIYHGTDTIGSVVTAEGNYEKSLVDVLKTAVDGIMDMDRVLNETRQERDELLKERTELLEDIEKLKKAKISVESTATLG